MSRNDRAVQAEISATTVREAETPWLSIQAEQGAAVAQEIEQERFRILAEHTPVMIWCVDASGAIQFVNQAYTRFFGITEEQACQPGWQPRIHPEDAEAYLAAFSAAVRSRTLFHAEARVRRHDGEWRWLEACGAPQFSRSGELLSYVGSSPDVTERKLRNQALREANHNKDVFLAMLGHELRNALGPLRLAHELLQRGRSSGSQSAGAHGIMHRQLEHVSRLVSDIVDLSAIGKGRVTLRPERVDLVEIAKNTAGDFATTLQSRGLSLSLSLPREAVVIEADPTRISQVLANLLQNACKFTDAGGEVEVGIATEPGYALLRVRDSGIGMDEQTQAHAFDQFVHGIPAPDPQRSGLGLGLALVKAFTEMHGGTVAVHSAGLGKGSTFVVRLPLARKA